MLQVAEATSNGRCKHEAAQEKTEVQGKAAGRDGHGRFAAGNKGGPGNPFARQTAGLRQAALRVVDREDIEEVFRQLTAKAKSGDVSAIKLLLSYTLGKPEKAVDPDTLDQQEWKLLQQNSIGSDELQALLCLMQMPLFLKMVRAVLPSLQEAQENMIHKAMTDSLSRPVGEVVKEYEDEDDLEEEEDGEELEQCAPRVDAQLVREANRQWEEFLHQVGEINQGQSRRLQPELPGPPLTNGVSATVRGP